MSARDDAVTGAVWAALHENSTVFDAPLFNAALRAAGYAVVPVGVVEALEKIASWCEAYPAQVFPKKSADHALDACKQAGIPVDAMHGTWARHLLSGIGRDARAALAAVDTPGGDGVE